MSEFESTTLNGSVYLIEVGVEDNQRVEFQYMPEVFNWDRKGNYSLFPVVGRNNSRAQLTGGEDILTFNLDFNSLWEKDKQMCLQKMSWLQSFTANDGYLGANRRVVLSWGNSDIFRGRKWIVKSVNSQASQFNGNFGYVPQQMNINIVLQLDPDSNTFLSDIRYVPGTVSGKDTPLPPKVNINDTPGGGGTLA